MARRLLGERHPRSMEAAQHGIIERGEAVAMGETAARFEVAAAMVCMMKLLRRESGYNSRPLSGRETLALGGRAGSGGRARTRRSKWRRHVPA